jgi:photosystem II stability/assembly factor-like uncharacterized protein
MKKLLVLLTMLIAINANAQWQAVGPWGGQVRCLSSNSTNIFAGTYTGGVFTSSDGGSNWVPVNNGFPPLQIGGFSVYALLTSENNVFAGLYGGGVYLSTNNGNSWTAKNSGIAGNLIYGLLKTGNTLYAAGGAHGMSKSTNNGDSWTVINNGLPGNKNCYLLSAKDGYVFVGTSQYGIFRSSNEGLNWTASNNGLSQLNIDCMINQNGVLFAGFGAYPGLYKSTDNGGNWININSIPNNYVRQLASSGNTLLAATHNGIYCSTDIGNNWVLTNSGLDSSLIECIYAAGNNLFAGTWGQGIFKSTNSGLNWNESNHGLGNISVKTFHNSGNNLYATTPGKGVQISSDFGQTFSPANGNMGNIAITSITSNGNYIFSGSPYEGIFVSSNNGMNWILSNNGLTDINISSLTTFNGKVYAGAPYPSGIFRTTNNGSSWQKVTNGLPSSFNGSELAHSSTKIYAGGSIELYASNDGDVWYSILGNLPQFPQINSIATVNDVVFVGTWGNGVYRSLNNGLNWSLINSAPYVWDMCSTGNYLFLASESGVYLSSNLGSSWRMINYNLPQTEITSISTDGTYLYVSSYCSGSFRNSISSIISINQIGSTVPSKYSLSQNYPNPFNPMCNVQFSMYKAGQVKLVVYDVQGREVQTLVNEKLSAGTYEVKFDGSMLNSGVYFYKLSTDGFTETKKMLMIK